MQIIDQHEFLRYYERIRARTMRVARCIPDDRLDWRPADGTFSFADLLRHLGATERWMFAENVSGRPSRYPGHGPEITAPGEHPIAYIDRMHRDAMNLFVTLDADGLAREVTTPGGATMVAWKWLRAMIEHEVHHRGQIYLMLRMIGVDAPPLYGLTSEQVRENSVV